ncbi:hypothetical protein [Erythrobacter sp. QSSC1-22B]|uniref:hypothetical protein n=1 Tax=Erythrobacter sp. QSSC1-22B TaxID=1860125 RepID=UPI0011A65656|nr:hypothetical protein [Erythrobacter sp. QSSC1-22B]
MKKAMNQTLAHMTIIWQDIASQQDLLTVSSVANRTHAKSFQIRPATYKMDGSLAQALLKASI